MPHSSLDDLKSAIKVFLGDLVYDEMNSKKTVPVLLYKQHEIACIEAFKSDSRGFYSNSLREWKIHIDNGGYYPP